MRKELILGVVALAALAGRTPAQTASTILGGPSPRNVTLRPIDVSRTSVPMPAIAAVQNNRFNFTTMFSKLFVPSAQKVRGVSPLPSPSSFPSYKDFMLVGTPPYPIGTRTASPIQPMAPIVPNTRTPVGPGSN